MTDETNVMKGLHSWVLLLMFELNKKLTCLWSLCQQINTLFLCSLSFLPGSLTLRRFKKIKKTMIVANMCWGVSIWQERHKTCTQMTSFIIKDLFNPQLLFKQFASSTHRHCPRCWKYDSEPNRSKFLPRVYLLVGGESISEIH